MAHLFVRDAGTQVSCLQNLNLALMRRWVGCCLGRPESHRQWCQGGHAVPLIHNPGPCGALWTISSPHMVHLNINQTSDCLKISVDILYLSVNEAGYFCNFCPFSNVSIRIIPSAISSDFFSFSFGFLGHNCWYSGHIPSSAFRDHSRQTQESTLGARDRTGVCVHKAKTLPAAL